MEPPLELQLCSRKGWSLWYVIVVADFFLDFKGARGVEVTSLGSAKVCGWGGGAHRRDR